MQPIVGYMITSTRNAAAIAKGMVELITQEKREDAGGKVRGA